MKQTAKRPQLFYFFIITVVMSVLVCSVSFTSSAKDIIFDDYGAYQEYLYYDFKPGDVVSYYPYVDEQGNVWDNSPVLHTLSEPNFSDFDINLIDLDTIPDYVQDIIYSDTGGVFIQVWASSYRIFVVNNGAFYFLSTQNMSTNEINRTSGMCSLCTTVVGREGYTTSVCYYAFYNYDGSLNTEWQKKDYSDFPSPYYKSNFSYCKRFFSLLAEDDCDFYYYGNFPVIASGGQPATSMSYAGDGSTSSLLYTVNVSKKPSITLEDCYVSSLDFFPSYESQELETSKSILDRIKELPETLSNFFTTLKNYLLYFSSEPVERTESAFSNLLDSVVNNLQMYIDGIDNYVNNELPSTRDNVVEYIEVGTMVIDDLFSGVPIISYLLLFAIAMIFVKKAVGK